MPDRIKPGPDPAFPVLDEYQRFTFPLERDKHSSIVAMGGNLSPGMLLSAYEQGVFPWYNPEDPILWHSPDPRFVLFKENLHTSKSMKRVLKKNTFEIKFDTNFVQVITGCAEAERPNQDGTWITRDVIDGYSELHRLGWAHSAESYVDGELAGGCYGIRLGSAFFGESMFSRVSNASKAAFLTMASILFNDGVEFIDSQVHTDYLESLGALEIPRADYMEHLKNALLYRWSLADKGNLPVFYQKADKADRRGNWAVIYAEALSRIQNPET